VETKPRKTARISDAGLVARVEGFQFIFFFFFVLISVGGLKGDSNGVGGLGERKMERTRRSF
jgi:hypothetical protein